MPETHWIIHSIITLFSLGIMLLIFKKLTLMGMDAKILNLYIFGLTFIGFFIFAVSNKTSLSISKTALLLLAIASIFAVIGNYYNIKGLAAAPNPGYHLAVAFARVAFVAVLSIFLFKSEFNWINFTGIIVTLIGLLLVSI